MRLARRFGPGVAAWCAGLPALADEVARQWRLRLGPAWPQGGTSVVLPCESADGEPLVLKLTPELKIAADEATALDAWRGSRPVVMLHDADLDHGALLLERVLPGTRLADEPDRWPLEEVAPLLAGMRPCPAGRGAGSGLPDLRDRAELVFDLTRRRLEQHPAVARRVPPDLVEASRRRARALATAGPSRLVHGDLHPGNVLRGGDGRGLVAIDPRPCLGDPAFDAADWMLADGGGEQAVRQRADWLAARVDDLDPERTWGWCQALAVVLAVALLLGAGDDAHAQRARSCSPWPGPLRAARPPGDHGSGHGGPAEGGPRFPAIGLPAIRLPCRWPRPAGNALAGAAP
ncbi:MAG TPA: aminoglycoside phosphotransferase family protein [Trebonia sp.]|nr:aminoglycoside phosphotransferase family protein [Trebonia sp.]